MPQSAHKTVSRQEELRKMQGENVSRSWEDYELRRHADSGSGRTSKRQGKSRRGRSR